MFITWLVDKYLQYLNYKTRVKVLVHEAFFENDINQEPYYFVKITNQSRENYINITHIWVAEKPNIEILNYHTVLPHKLKQAETWETWFKKSLIKDHKNIFNNVRVVLSSGKEYKSKKNYKVRPRGFVS